MIIQWGKYPEFTLTICNSAHRWGGEFALPIKLSWWNSIDSEENKNNNVSITVLCFNIELEIWRFAGRK